MNKLVPCKSCKKEIAKSAKTCPHCGIKDPGVTASDTAKGCLGIMGLGLIIAFFVNACEETKTPEQIKQEAVAKIEQDCRDGTMAFVMSQGFVEKRLKSPSTAKFPYVSDEGVKVGYIGECTNLVVAYVDSQNGFGATVRSQYAVKIKYNPEDETYTALDVVIE